MKIQQNLLIYFLIASTSIVYARDEKYTNAMIKGLEILNGARSSDQYRLAANYFERVASAESKEWLPLYYAAYSNLYSGLFINDRASKDALYDQANLQLKKANDLSPNNSEIYALQGYVILMKLAVDPTVRSMMMPEGIQLLEKAKKLNPDNPRSYLIHGQFVFFMPEAFGGGKTKAKPILSIGNEKYKIEKPATALSPSWGKGRLEELLKKCE